MRREYDIDEDQLEQQRIYEQKKILEWQKALTNLSSSEDVIEATARVLLINPDYYHAWNLRKRSILKGRLNVKDELEFSLDTIKKGPKSYYAWYHRKWIIQQAFPDDQSKSSFNIDQELHLCMILLDLDKRNCNNARIY